MITLLTTTVWSFGQSKVLLLYFFGYEASKIGCSLVGRFCEEEASNGTPVNVHASWKGGMTSRYSNELGSEGETGTCIEKLRVVRIIEA